MFELIEFSGKELCCEEERFAEGKISRIDSEKVVSSLAT
jgi:hypothetical protein